MSIAACYAHLLTWNLHSPLKDLLKLYNCQTDSIIRSHSSVSRSHGWENRKHPGFFQPTLELCYWKTQPGGLQHSLPGGPPDASPAGPPHYVGGVLPLLLLSPCQQLLLLLLLRRHHGNRKVRNKEEKGFGQYRRLVDLRQDWQGRPCNGVGRVELMERKTQTSVDSKEAEDIVQRTSHCNGHKCGWTV